MIFQLISLFISFSVFAYEDGFGELISTISTNRSVSVDQIKTRFEGSSLSRCTRYENDNSYDGDCLEWRSYCHLYVRFPGTDSLGNPEEYVADPSFFDPSMQKDAYNFDCEELLREWSRTHSGEKIHYKVTGSVYERFQWNWGKPNRVPKVRECSRTRIIRSEAMSGKHLLVRVRSSSQKKVSDRLCHD